MLHLDPNDPVTVPLTAIMEFAQKNRCYNKTAFREKLAEAGQSAPEILRGRFAHNILEKLHDRLFCEVVELRHCQPIHKTHACQCNKVMVSWDDNTKAVCDRVIVGMVKTKDRGWDCNTALGNEYNKCTFKNEVPCDSWPGVDAIILQHTQGTRHDPLKHEAAGEFAQPPRFGDTKQDGSRSEDKSTGGANDFSGQSPPPEPAGKTHSNDGNTYWSDEDL